MKETTATQDLVVVRPRDIALGIEMFPSQTPTLPPATHTNSFALGTGEVLLVEPAPSSRSECDAWVDWVKQVRASGRKLVALLATHHHSDHVGAEASYLCSALELPLWAHEATAQRLVDLPFDRLLSDGEVLQVAGRYPQRWEVLHTPGHAPGHLCLFERDLQTLVLGDMVASQGTILIAPGDGDMREYLAQLDRLASLEARLGLPAHGDPIDAPSDLIRATIAHRGMREDKVLDGLAQGQARGLTLDELLPTAYDDTPTTLWPLARLSLQSHLDKLVADGLAAVSGERWLFVRD